MRPYKHQRTWMLVSEMVAFNPLLWTVAFLTAGVQVGAAPTSLIHNDSIGDIINILRLGLITQINAFISLGSLSSNIISVNFEVRNPLIVEVTIDRVVSRAGINGTVYAQFDHTFSPGLVVPILSSANSGTFGNVVLTQGALNTLGILSYGMLDLTADVHIRVVTIFGKLGIPITIMGLKQSNVPANYTLQLGQ